MPVRQGQNQTILGCFVRTSRRTLCGKRRGRPLRVLAMAVFGALVFYFILFVHIPNNGLGDGNVNSFKNSHRDIFQVNNLALRNIDVLGRERDARGTDRHGRVLMKGQELQDDRNSDKNNDTLIAASYPSSLASNDSAQVDPSDMVIGGLNVVSMGCYKDATIRTRRALQGAFFSDINRMTIERCLLHCNSKSFPFAGMEFSSECFCGHAVTASRAPEKGLCNMTCSGNRAEICGGAPYISIYQIKSPAEDRPLKGGGAYKGYHEVPTGRGYDFRACVPYRGTEGKSVFPGGVLIEQSSMSAESCIKACQEKKHPLAGMTKGKECHCGHLTGEFDLQDKVDPEKCNSPCPGDENVFCGAEQFVSIYQTPHRDERCTEMTLKKPGSMALIALASFPGSGNTWVRYLLERASGIYTGSYYDDGDLYNKGFKGEREHWLKRNTIAVKTHRFDEEHVATYDGVILIIRDPYKAILSEHNRKFGGHTGYANERHYTQGTEWIDFVTGKSRTWTNTAINFLQYNKNVLVVHYEDLRSNLKPNLEKMLRFLQVPLDNDRILCTISSPDGKYKRPAAKKKLNFDPYTDEMKEYISLYVKALSMALHITNQTKLPDSYDPHLKFLL